MQGKKIEETGKINIDRDRQRQENDVRESHKNIQSETSLVVQW